MPEGAGKGTDAMVAEIAENPDQHLQITILDDSPFLPRNVREGSHISVSVTRTATTQAPPSQFSPGGPIRMTVTFSAVFEVTGPGSIVSLGNARCTENVLYADRCPAITADR